MSSYVNDSIKQWLWEKRIPYPINVTLTEKQSFRGQKIDDVVSDSNFRHFKNVLNQKTFGNGYRRFGKHLRMLVVREVSPLLRHHLHCIIENPHRFRSEEFVRLIKQIWRSTDFGYEKIHVENPSSPNREDGWLSYILKDKSKVNLFDSIDWNNTHL